MYRFHNNNIYICPTVTTPIYRTTVTEDTMQKPNNNKNNHKKYDRHE